MTKKDYIKIADILKIKYEYIKSIPDCQCCNASMFILNDIIVDFCDMLKQDNSNFNDEKFINYIKRGEQ